MPSVTVIGLHSGHVIPYLVVGRCQAQGTDNPSGDENGTMFNLDG